MKVADKLNALLAVPVCKGGKVRLERHTNEESNFLFDQTRSLNEEELKELADLGLEPDEDGIFGCLDEHPEGSDRGGYVPTITQLASPSCGRRGYYTHYSENDGEWQ